MKLFGINQKKLICRELKPDAGDALKIAALSHDIERAIEERKVRREDYKDYDEFKAAHASNSANILVEIMKECNISTKLADDIFFLVCHHETGGTKRVDVLEMLTASRFSM